MARYRALLAGGILVAAAVAWLVFRPETAFIDRVVDEPRPADAASVLLRGSFVSRAHEGRGLAEVLELSAGQRVLRFTEFETLDGPDLYVYLLGAPDATNTSELETGGFLSLGPLKGNVGAQNYNIPADADLSRYGGVAVWCRRFSVNFTSARFR